MIAQKCLEEISEVKNIIINYIFISKYFQAMTRKRLFSLLNISNYFNGITQIMNI